MLSGAVTKRVRAKGRPEPPQEGDDEGEDDGEGCDGEARGSDEPMPSKRG